MKKALIVLFLLASEIGFAQVDLSKVNKDNTWLKLGVNVGLPIADLKASHGYVVGLDASVQFLETKASGIGLKAGLLNYTGKDLVENIVVIPLAVLYRHYPESTGFFAGLEAGYGLINNFPGTEGGIYVRPHAGLHTDNWNFLLYYDHVTTEENVANIQAIGVGVLYNLRFK
jgi:hypothetical protein